MDIRFLSSGLLWRSYDAYPEPVPGIDALDGRVPGVVAEGRDLQLVGRRIGDAAVVVMPVPQEVVARRLRRERVKDLHDVAALLMPTASPPASCCPCTRPRPMKMRGPYPRASIA